MRKTITVLCAAALLAVATSYTAAETDAEWRPNSRNDPTTATCSKIWKGVGLPRYAPAGANKITVCHDRYVLSHDNASKTPDWVVEHLTRRQLTNKFKRPKESFDVDRRVPPSGRSEAGDYAKTADKFEIGHMAPSEDFNNSEVAMRDSFYFSNAVPQAGDKFNAAIWKTLETEVRKAATARKEIYVMTGPVRGTGTARTINIAKSENACGGKIELDAIKTRIVCKAVNQKKAETCTTGVVVPVAVYKIVYDPKAEAAYAFVMPNRNHPTGQGRVYLDGWRVNVGVIEKLTGLQFFSALSADKREKAVNKCETTPFWAAAVAKKKKKPR